MLHQCGAETLSFFIFIVRLNATDLCNLFNLQDFVCIYVCIHHAHTHTHTVYQYVAPFPCARSDILGQLRSASGGAGYTWEQQTFYS